MPVETVPPAPKVLRILIVEDTPERQKVLQQLVRDHAWVMVGTAARAVRLVGCYPFDLIFLDYDLAGPDRGDVVAAALADTPNASTKVIVHSMSAPGARRIAAILPAADVVPISKITRSNATFKRLRQELQQGPEINWTRVFEGHARRTGHLPLYEQGEDHARGTHR